MLLTRAFEGEQSLAVNMARLGMPIELRRSSRAKRFTLKVSHTERTAILTLPDRGCIEDADQFLSRHLDWLKSQIAKIPAPVPLTDGQEVPVRGVTHRLSFVGPVRYMGVVWADEGDKQADAGGAIPRLCVAGGREHAARRLLDWLKLEARKDLFYRVHHHASNLGIYPNRISIRDQATRWGSCSSNGGLSFSWRLIFAPSYVLDYIAAHEVAHLKEMNHGPRFWRLVRQTMPQMQEARTWLKKRGTELHRFNLTADTDI
jgi:predicted metal-dependent hydrolase